MSTTAQERDHAWIMARVEELKARGDSEPKLARDPVNQPMINNWLEAIGDTDPRWASGEAPPAMAQVWTMDGLDRSRRENSPLHATMAIFDEAGYTSVLGTNCDQRYLRPLRVGEHVSLSARLADVTGPKRTGVGEGYFITTENTWRVGDEVVATMSFRVLKYKPGTGRAPAVDRTKLVRPQRNRDTEFLWEGLAAEELRIQQCNACGALRHPPGPMCPQCHAADRGYVVAGGGGTIYSWIEHHAPALPGKALPATIALVELDEGVRMVGEILPPPTGGVEIGDAVRVVFEHVDDEITLAQWEVVR